MHILDVFHHVIEVIFAGSTSVFPTSITWTIILDAGCHDPITYVAVPASTAPPSCSSCIAFPFLHLSLKFS